MTNAHTPHNVGPIAFGQGILVARQSCASVFARGGTPRDALVMFGIAAAGNGSVTWAQAVDRIAQSLTCGSRQLPQAA
ncbi:MAG: hypothetical protein AAFQ45_06690 [Pseudomonadota bacterium]